MSKPANKKSTDHADRIPTLTEIVSSAEPLLEPSIPVEGPAKAAKTPVVKASELPKDLAPALERLVYKTLYRQLAPLSKEISAEILDTLEKQLLDKKSR